MTFAERYEAGEFEDVWSELIALGSVVRQTPHFADAQSVASATMLRAKTNVERLTQLLPTIGWHFAYPQTGPPTNFAVWIRPSPETPNMLAQLEREVGGPIPVSLSTFWSAVGSVCLIRKPTDEGVVQYPDPLVVAPLQHAFIELDEWRENESFRDLKPTFAVPIAPDAYHKEDVSGGAPYEMELPNPVADGPVLNLDPSMMFVAYLRHAFKWAGLPGYANLYDKPPPNIAAIAGQLLPL